MSQPTTQSRELWEVLRPLSNGINNPRVTNLTSPGLLIGKVFPRTTDGWMVGLTWVRVSIRPTPDQSRTYPQVSPENSEYLF